MSRRRGRSKASSIMKEENEEIENCDVPEPAVKRKKSSKTILKYEKRDVLFDRNGNSIIKYYENLQNGNLASKYKHSVKLSLINYIKTFHVSKTEAPFDRRVTFIEWHPKNPRLLAVASKGGDIILWNYEDPIELAYSVQGIGAGGSVQAMKFDLTTPHKIYTVSIEGKFLVLDFHTKKAEQFLDTLDFKRWYVSLDINWGSKTMVVGDNKGVLTVLTTDGEVTSTIKVHNASSRVTHTEFSKREPWLICTTSNDKTIKLWDIRQLKKDKRNAGIPLDTIVHEKPINAAYFSLSDGCRLLTTDQFDKINVYRSPLWHLETEISHPHRQYQHLTPIRAYWHPFEDVIFIGRYPHIEFPGYTPGELRTIDFFDAGTGELLHQHSEPGFNGIATLNKFNVTGDAWAAGTGTRILIWKPKFRSGESIELKNDDDKDDGPEPPADRPVPDEAPNRLGRNRKEYKLPKSKGQNCSKKSKERD